MAQIKKLSTELQPLDKLLDSSGDAGTSGQILSSTGSGTNWISASSGTITGSGTTGYIPKWTGSSALGNSILEVNSALPNDVIIPQYIRHAGDTNTYFGFYSNDNFRIITNNNAVVTVTDAGRVGIGTTSPSRTLHVGGAGGSSGGIMISPTSGDAEIQFQDSGTTNAYITLDDGTHDLNFRDDSATVMTVDFASERVGIGTTNPENKLHILTSTSDTTQQLLIQNGSTGDAAIKFNISGDTYSFGIDNSDSDKFKLSAGNLGTNDRITVDSSGLVGIGTTSPSTKLHVYNGEATIASSTDGVKLSYSNGNSSGVIDTAFSDNALEFRTNGTSKMFIANAGEVGIGTNSPGRKLHVYDDNAAAIKIQAGDANQARLDLANSAGAFGIITNGGTFRIYDDTDSAERLKIDTSGRVGIGTTNPNEKLEVSGNIRASGSYKVGATEVISSGRRFFAADGSSSAPAYSFSGRTDTGMFVDDHVSNDRIFFSVDGTARAYIDSNGISSNATIYVSSAGSFRNYSGHWRATTGTSGNGFYFFNTADNNSAVLLNITSVSSAATDSVATFSGKVKSAQTASSDGNDVLATKGYVDGLVTGVTRYMGLWDASDGTGGSPDLTASTYKVPGYYFIVSVAGDAEPNGAGTEPDTWHVGDWVIWSDQATDAWQKIDNTSVLSGTGTANKVAMWNGDESLTNAPITISGNDSTFTGNINLASNNINLDNNSATIFDNSNNNNAWYIRNGGTSSATLQFGLGTPGANIKHTFDGDGNIAFGGDLTVSGGHLTLKKGTTYAQATDYLYIGGSGLDNADAAIYLGNRGDGNSYGCISIV